MSKFQVIVYGETTAINQLLFDEFVKVLVEECGDPYCKWTIKRIPMSDLFPEQEIKTVMKDFNKVATFRENRELKIEDATADNWIPVLRLSDLPDKEKQQVQSMKRLIRRAVRLAEK